MLGRAGVLTELAKGTRTEAASLSHRQVTQTQRAEEIDAVIGRGVNSADKLDGGGGG